MKETDIEQLLDIAALINRYGKAELTEMEAQRLNSWLEISAANRELFNELSQEQEPVPVSDAAALNASANRVYTAIGFKKPGTIRISRLWWAAAAIIAGITGLYVWYRPIDKKEIVQARQDVLPGGNKATITLADGSIITLDSTANGMLTQQGGTKVIKSANGEVVYDAAANANQEIQYNTMTTPRGGQYKLVLPDGSRVWLNAASSISYPTAFVGDDRSVIITGEAYFEVTANGHMPFHVKVNKMNIDVLGTHFNVMAYDDEPVIKTTLLEGAIKVNNTLLRAGQQSQLDQQGALKLIQDADKEEAIAWKNGLFEFNHERLSSIIRKLNRWYDVDIEYSANTGNKTFTGQISRNANLSTVLQMLEITQGIHFKIGDKTIRVMP